MPSRYYITSHLVVNYSTLLDYTAKTYMTSYHLREKVKGRINAVKSSWKEDGENCINGNDKKIA